MNKFIEIFRPTPTSLVSSLEPVYTGSRDTLSSTSNADSGSHQSPTLLGGRDCQGLPLVRYVDILGEGQVCCL